MTADEIEELLADCPTLFHMAERGSWTSIRQRGLLSTCGLLDLFDVTGASRRAIEGQRRARSVTLERAELGRAVVRDQLAMDDIGLTRCLKDGLVPEGWYKLLNSKVFFWLTRERLLRLLNAGTYCEDEHDVLELDTRSLVAANRERIWLCPINSGCTKPFPHPRGIDTFQRIEAYPYPHWRAKRRSGERVVELAVDYGIPDISVFVRRVVRMKGNRQLDVLFNR